MSWKSFPLADRSWNFFLTGDEGLGVKSCELNPLNQIWFFFSFCSSGVPVTWVWWIYQWSRTPTRTIRLSLTCKEFRVATWIKTPVDTKKIIIYIYCNVHPLFAFVPFNKYLIFPQLCLGFPCVSVKTFKLINILQEIGGITNSNCPWNISGEYNVNINETTFDVQNTLLINYCQNEDFCLP